MEKQIIIDRLKRFARSQWPTMKVFAESLQISPGSLSSSLFSGRSLPSAEMLFKCSIFGLDINWLLTGRGRAPDPTVAEMKDWIQQCEGWIKEYSRYVKTEEDAYAEILASTISEMRKREPEALPPALPASPPKAAPPAALEKAKRKPTKKTKDSE